MLNADGKKLEGYSEDLFGMEDDGVGPMRDCILQEARGMARRLENQQQEDIEKLHRPANPCKVNTQAGATC